VTRPEPSSFSILKALSETEALKQIKKKKKKTTDMGGIGDAKEMEANGNLARN
jgi:hypothetical protein